MSGPLFFLCVKWSLRESNRSDGTSPVCSLQKVTWRAIIHLSPFHLNVFFLSVHFRSRCMSSDHMCEISSDEVLMASLQWFTCQVTYLWGSEGPINSQKQCHVFWGKKSRAQLLSKPTRGRYYCTVGLPCVRMQWQYANVCESRRKSRQPEQQERYRRSVTISFFFFFLRAVVGGDTQIVTQSGNKDGI